MDSRMQSVSLDGVWKLTYFPEDQYQFTQPDQLAQADADVVPAHVPGNVELDLVRAGIIPDPFYADNIHHLRPYETYEWWYSREFDLPDSRNRNIVPAPVLTSQRHSGTVH